MCGHHSQKLKAEIYLQIELFSFTSIIYASTLLHTHNLFLESFKTAAGQLFKKATSFHFKLVQL